MTTEGDFAAGRVAVAGLGLMGASLAGALTLHHACRQVVGISRRPESIHLLTSRGWIHEGTTDLRAGIAAADVVVLATPPRVVLHQLGEVGPALADGALVMDLASTKAEIARAMMALPAHIQPLGGHPMCGKEKAGPDAADPHLFEGRVFVLSPLERTSPAALETGRQLVQAIGAQPFILDAEEHDRMVAWISHLPHMAALALMHAAMAGAGESSALWELAAGGFRDTTRLAASDREMMLDIFTTNAGPLLRAAREFQHQLEQACAWLEAGDEDTLRAWMDTAIQRRRELDR